MRQPAKNEENEKVAKVQHLHERVRQLRGRLLNTLAVIDVRVSRLLAAYFCHNDDRRNLAFSEVFVSRLRLEYKARLLEKIVKKEFSWYLERHTPNVFKDLHEVREFRNTLAHATVDVSEEALAKDPAKEVGFVYYKDGQRKVKLVTAEIATEIQVRANMVSTSLMELGTLLGLKREQM
jgi:hypothetical protein